MLARTPGPSGGVVAAMSAVLLSLPLSATVTLSVPAASPAPAIAAATAGFVPAPPAPPATGSSLSAAGSSLSAARAALPASTQLPGAGEQLDRFVEAIGGEEAIREAPARRLRGTIEVTGQGISGTMEVVAAPPDRMATRVEFPGLGVIRSGHDGEVAWMVHPAVGPTVMEGRTRDQYLQGADFFYPLGQERWTESMRTVEELEFDGRRCYKVRVTTTGGEEYFMLFDAETGLQAGSVRTYHSPAGSSETTTVRQAYGEVGGVLVPVRMENRSAQGDQVIEFTDLETLDPDPETFRPPAEVREIIGSPGS